ncbi:MAG: Ig-like domain-containing protein [Erysipelotrichaceae bacterium]|nr:Ig-like domain-containing protein [Erysipelotrichaceae bacterium]
MKKAIKVILWGIVVVLVFGLVDVLSQMYAFNLDRDSLTVEYGDTIGDLYQYTNLDDKRNEDVTIICDDVDSFDDIVDVGEYDIHYQYYLLDKTLHLSVVDTTVPELTLLDEPEIFESEDFDYRDYVTVEELSDCEVILDDSDVNYDKAGSYEAKVTAMDIYNNTSTLVFPVTVKELTLTLSQSQMNLVAGESDTLTAQSNSDKYIKLSSSDEDVATIDSQGNVKAIKSGTATISATILNKTATCQVKVQAISLSLSKSSLSLTVGNTTSLKATTNSSQTVSFSSNDTSVASVDSDGKVTAKSAGTATITVSVGDQSKTCKVTVKAKATSSSSSKSSSNSNSTKSSSSSSSSYTVYITKTGECYHRGTCSSLRKSKIAISKSDAIARGYRACKNCKP